MRDALVAAANEVCARGLSHGASGNISVRVPQGLLITPSGIASRALTPEQMVTLDASGRPEPGQMAPSSEWPFHQAVYAARADVNAIVHVHSPYATALACTRTSLPAVHYTVALGGQDHIPCARYAKYGSRALADNVVDALGAHGLACLMANHGSLSAGSELTAAIDLAEEVEFLSRVYLLARAAGDAQLLDHDEMRDVLASIRSYGQPSRDE